MSLPDSVFEPLMMDALAGKVPTAERLQGLAWSSDPDDHQATAIMTWAVIHRSALVAPLLRAGVSPNARHQDVVRQRASPASPDGPARNGATLERLAPGEHGVLVDAVRHSSPTALDALLTAGAVWNHRPPPTPDPFEHLVSGRCALWESESEFWPNQDGRMLVLQRHGFVPHPGTLATALPQLVVQRGAPSLIAPWAALGADLTAHLSPVTTDGSSPGPGTALHLAMDRPSTMVYVAPLLNAGADPERRDDQGRTVLERLESRLVPRDQDQVQPEERAVWRALQALALRRTLPSPEAAGAPGSARRRL